MHSVAAKLKAWGVISLAAVLVACGGGDEYNGFDDSVDSSTPNKFLLYFNRQADLAAGNYTLVAATNAPGEADTFSITIKRKSGATQLITGSWTSSGGLDSDPTCASGNRCYSVSLDDASGATFKLTSAVDSVLYLVDDSNVPKLVATANNSVAGAESLDFSESENDADKLTNAYYAAIDPGNARDTVQKYIAMHGLGSPDVHVIFRDSKDLGYGRDMYMRVYRNDAPPNPGPIAAAPCGGADAITYAWYVRNFSVKIVEGFAYGPVNLEAAIAEDLDYHVGTNAIEFGYGRSDYGDTCSTVPMAKFYTFEPNYDTPGAPHPRRTRVDLDARGTKAMPQPCISCHGGKLRPLDRFGRFVAINAGDTEQQIGDTKARMQAFEVDTFEFSDLVGHRRADYEEGLRRLNAAIYCTYPGSFGHAACDDFALGLAPGNRGTPDHMGANALGEWSGDFAREMLEGWYSGTLETPGSKFDDSYIPMGWRPSIGGPPVGADALFKKVVGPNCFVCHGKRGFEKGINQVDGTLNDSTDGKEIDFGSWDKFISHADEIERLVFDEGRMPLGLLNFQNFWDDPEKAELLAGFIAPYVSNPAGFQARRVDSSGDIIEPGERVIARAGPDRVTLPNEPITLNAQASLFADTYSWQVISSPVGSAPSLSRPSSIRTAFSADIPGDYIVRLTASLSESGASRRDTVRIVVDAGLATAPRALSFYSDISTFLTANCTSCHDSGVQPGVPVWWVDDASQPLGIPASAADPASLGFYEQVMARVNLEYIEDSLLLKKPSGTHHFGQMRPGFDTSLAAGAMGRANYDMFVNWIAEGAVCGMVGDECPGTM